MYGKKGQVGLNIFLSVIVLIFVTGILVMAFVLTGAKINEADTSYDRTSATSVSNESQYMNGSIGYFDLDNSALKSVVCSVSNIFNESDQSVVIGSGNYSASNCRITQSTSTFENQTWYVNYTYTYLTPNEVYDVVNGTSNAITTSADWFPIFITISAVVVLILLIVLIIVSLRGAGLMGGGNMGA